jgi:TIR domain
MRGWRAGLASASHSRNSDYATRKIDFAQYSQASAAGVTGYSRADWRHAAKIDSLLRAKGLRPFFDRRSLAPGLPWLKALEQAIGAAKAAIVLIGPRGLGNTQQYERDLALIRQTRDPVFPVVPVILPETTTDPCPCRKLDPHILMMQSSQDGAAKYAANGLDSAWDRRILVQG